MDPYQHERDLPINSFWNMGRTKKKDFAWS